MQKSARIAEISTQVTEVTCYVHFVYYWQITHNYLQKPLKY